MATTGSGRRPVVVVEAPAHPVTQLQGPFEESMFESQTPHLDDIDIPLDANTRRNMLLEAPTYQRVIGGRWKQKSGEKYHPLWKLIAQLSFGIHLLSENMAKSEDDVFQILQTHVDDIDGFLERTTEDFALAQDDIQERLKCLKLPLQHPEVFDRMLEDRAFRNSIVDGNEKIEHIVNRTGCAMKDALKDVQKGFDSTTALEKYLTDLDTTWLRDTPEHDAVYVAMLGNVEGWKKAFLDLHVQANKLAGSLRKLTDVINQMQQRAGEVSRRLVRQQSKPGRTALGGNSSVTYLPQQSSSRSSSRQQATPSPNQVKKPLPGANRAQDVHSASRNSPHKDRSGTQQSIRSGPERTGTAQSNRSAGDIRAPTPNSRSASRNEDPATDSSSTRMNIGSPRLVEIKNFAGHHRTHSQSASIRLALAPEGEQPLQLQQQQQQQQQRDPNSIRRPTRDQYEHKEVVVESLRPGQRVLHNSNSNLSQLSAESQATLKQTGVRESQIFAPVELPAEIPPEAFLSAPMSSKSRLSANLEGLGILPSSRRAQAKQSYNPTTALIELLNDPGRFSKLPLTPTSSGSPRTASPATALSALEGKAKASKIGQDGTAREPTPEKTPPNLAAAEAANSMGSDPSTPAWASQVVDDSERAQLLAGGVSLPSSKREGPLTSRVNKVPSGTNPPAKPIPSKLSVSVEEATRAKGAATATPALSELSAGYEESMPKLTRKNLQESAMLFDTPSTAAPRKGPKSKLAIVAELEGSNPLLLQPTIYTPTSTISSASVPAELDEARNHANSMSGLESKSASSVSALETPKEVALGGVGLELPLGGEADVIQLQLEEAIRASITEADIIVPETPGTKEKQEVEDDTQRTTPRPSTAHPIDISKIGPEAEKMPPLASTVSDELSSVSVNEESNIATGTAATDDAAQPVGPKQTEDRSSFLIPSSPTGSESSIDIGEILEAVTATSGGKNAIVATNGSSRDPDLSTSTKLDGKQVKRASTIHHPPSSRPSGTATPIESPPMTTEVRNLVVDTDPMPLPSLERANSAESKKQWKNFFANGSNKGPKSPATSVHSAKSASTAFVHGAISSPKLPTTQSPSNSQRKPSSDSTRSARSLTGADSVPTTKVEVHPSVVESHPNVLLAAAIKTPASLDSKDINSQSTQATSSSKPAVNDVPGVAPSSTPPTPPVSALTPLLLPGAHSILAQPSRPTPRSVPETQQVKRKSVPVRTSPQPPPTQMTPPMPSQSAGLGMTINLDLDEAGKEFGTMWISPDSGSTNSSAAAETGSPVQMEKLVL